MFFVIFTGRHRSRLRKNWRVGRFIWPGYGSVEREGYGRVGEIRASRTGQYGQYGRAGRVRHSRAGRVRRVRASRVGRVRVRRLRTSRLGGAGRKLPVTSGQSQSCVSSRLIHSNELC